MKKIPKQETVRLVVALEVDKSVDELTDREVMKLTKDQLQIGMKAMRRLIIDCRKSHGELSSMVKDYDGMVLLLEANGYAVEKVGS